MNYYNIPKLKFDKIPREKMRLLIYNSPFKKFQDEGILKGNNETIAFQLSKSVFNIALKRTHSKALLVPGYIDYMNRNLSDEFDPNEILEKCQEIVFDELNTAHFEIEVGLRILTGKGLIFEEMLENAKKNYEKNS